MTQSEEEKAAEKAVRNWPEREDTGWLSPAYEQGYLDGIQWERKRIENLFFDMGAMGGKTTLIINTFRRLYGLPIEEFEPWD